MLKPLDVDLLLRAGSIQGPYRRARPALCWWALLIRILRRWQIKGLKP